LFESANAQGFKRMLLEKTKLVYVQQKKVCYQPSLMINFTTTKFGTAKNKGKGTHVKKWQIVLQICL
jgi:hypothetical protein